MLFRKVRTFTWNQPIRRIKKSMEGISQKVLTAQLRDMERTGLINRKVYVLLGRNI